MKPSAQPEAHRGDVLQWSATLALLAAASGAFAYAFVNSWFAIERVLWTAALCAIPGMLYGAGFGALHSTRARLRCAWLVPVLLFGGGALLIYLTTWQQSDHGGLATAGLIFVLLAVALVAFGFALLYTLLRRKQPLTQLRVLLAMAAALAIAAAARTATAPRVSPMYETLAVESQVGADVGPRGAALDAGLVHGRPTERAHPPYDPEALADCPEAEPLPPLFSAIAANDSAKVSALLAKDGVSANLRCDYGEGTSGYPLGTALGQEKLEIAKLLLESGADPNLTGEGGEWPLTLAVRARSLDLVQRLIAAGADVNAERQGVSVLFEAAGSGDAEIVRALLEAGAHPDTSFAGTFAIHLAAEGNSSEMLKAFIDAGADLDVPGSTHERPSALAARAGRTTHVRMLLDAGAMDTTTAVKGALVGGHVELARELSKRGLNVAQHFEGCDVLALAAATGDVQFVAEILAGSGRIGESCRNRALDEARRSGGDSSSVLELLRSLP